MEHETFNSIGVLDLKIALRKEKSKGSGFWEVNNSYVTRLKLLAKVLAGKGKIEVVFPSCNKGAIIFT